MPPMPNTEKQKEPSKMAKELADRIERECFHSYGYDDASGGWFDVRLAAEIIQEYTNTLRKVLDAQTMSSYPPKNQG